MHTTVLAAAGVALLGAAVTALFLPAGTAEPQPLVVEPAPPTRPSADALVPGLRD